MVSKERKPITGAWGQCRGMIDNKYPILCIFARNCQQEGQHPLTGQHTANFRLSFL